jgi:hypothetical protein
MICEPRETPAKAIRVKVAPDKASLIRAIRDKAILDRAIPVGTIPVGTVRVETNLVGVILIEKSQIRAVAKAAARVAKVNAPAVARVAKAVAKRVNDDARSQRGSGHSAAPWSSRSAIGIATV